MDRIVVGYDNSHASRAPLASAGEQAVPVSSELLLIYMSSPIAAWELAAAQINADPIRHEFQRRLREELTQGLRGTQLPYHTKFVAELAACGNPAQDLRSMPRNLAGCRRFHRCISFVRSGAERNAWPAHVFGARDTEGPTQTDKAGHSGPHGRRSPSDTAGEDDDAPATPRSGSVDVMLVDNRTVTREGISALIERQPDFFVVGQAATISDAGSLGVRPRVIVTEVDLPDAKHGAVISGLREHFREASILVLTFVGHPAKVQTVLDAGANGYLLKTAGTIDFFAGIRAVAAGHFYLQPSLGVELARWHRPRDSTTELSPMEEKVLKRIALGHTNFEIARICHMSLRTVESHRAHIQRKLDRYTRAELVEYVREVGLIDFDPF
jgi:two-component system response regulator NreC